MKYLAVFIITTMALCGCNRNANLVENETSSGAADSGAAQVSVPIKSDTLKVTYSKSDPFNPSQSNTKDAKPNVNIHEGHESKEKSLPVNSEHKEHQLK